MWGYRVWCGDVGVWCGDVGVVLGCGVWGCRGVVWRCRCGVRVWCGDVGVWCGDVGVWCDRNTGIIATCILLLVCIV